MHKRKCRWLGLVLSLVLCLALSGVSSVAAQQGVNNKVVTIGLTGAMSGPLSAGTQVLEGARIYLEMVNRTGGVNGYTFKTIARDNAGQPAQGLSVIQQLLKEDKVFAMLVSGTPVIQAMVPTAASLKIPIFTSGNGDLVLPTIANVYAQGPRYTIYPLFDAQFIVKNLNIKEIAYVYEDDSIGRPGLANLPAYLSANGAKLVASLGFAADTTDFAPFATKLKESGAKAVLFFGVNQLASLQKAADAIGYHPTYTSNWPQLIPAYFKLAGPLAEGVYIDTFAEPVDAATPSAQKFRDEMTRTGNQPLIGSFGALGWSAGAIFAEGVKRATANGAPLTWQSYINAVDTINNEPMGLFQSITYTPKDHSGFTKAAMYQVKGGKFVEVLPVTDIPQAPGK